MSSRVTTEPSTYFHMVLEGIEPPSSACKADVLAVIRERTSKHSTQILEYHPLKSVEAP